MDNESYTDPASRAAIFIGKFRDVVISHGQSRPDRLVRHALSRVYGYDPEDTAKAMDVLSRLWRIPGDIEDSLVKAQSSNLVKFSNTIEGLRLALSSLVLSTDATSVVKQRFTKDLEERLYLVGQYLQVHQSESMPPRDRVEKILEQIDDLSKEIKDSGLEDSFIDYFLHRLDEVRYALNHYDTLGPYEVMRRVSEIYGGVFGMYSQVRKSDDKRKIVGKIWTIVSTIVVLMNFGNGAFELVDNFDHINLVGSGRDEEG